MNHSQLLPYHSPRYHGDSATEASSSPASCLTDPQLIAESLTSSPQLWDDFMHTDYSYHPTTACGFLAVTSLPHGAFADQTMADEQTFGLDPLIIPQSGLSDVNLPGGDLIPAIPDSAFVPTTTTASMPPLGIDHLHSASSPRVDQMRLQLTPARAPRARQRGQSTAADESGGDARSLSPTSEEERLQERRRRNKLASRRLRQKHLDHVSELQSRLEVVMQERDELRLRAAKWEGEVMVLRNLFENRTHARS